MPRAGAPAWRAGLGVIGVVVVVASLVGVGLHVAGPEGPPAEASAVQGPGAREPGAQGSPTTGDDERAGTAGEDLTRDRADPAEAAAELTRRRAGLLTGDRTVDEVSLVGSAAHRADTELVDRADRSGTTVTGAELTVTSARATQGPTDGAAEVVVEYVVGPHEQVVDGGGTVQVEAGEQRTATLTLAWTSDGWRVTDVE